MRFICLLLALAGSAAAIPFARPMAASLEGGELRPPSAFSDIADPAARSRALFAEAAKVITGPRCMNCHPSGDHPTQGDDRHIHEPAVVRGPADTGIPGLTCSGCHTDRNVTLFVGEASYQSIPGIPGWRLAPLEMAWQGRTVGEICRQIKDPQRNGGRNLALLHDHIASDQVVSWAWAPGKGRAPAPGSQQRLGELIQAWIDTGAACP